MHAASLAEERACVFTALVSRDFILSSDISACQVHEGILVRLDPEKDLMDVSGRAERRCAELRSCGGRIEISETSRPE
ncbi:MAG: hypothetical protein F4X92_11620 [Gammaproteobacteria bacterium]|nr:hypothetical protein [Gammaproteobacteria bacterium]